MIEPSPNCFVMEERASSMFLSRATFAVEAATALLSLAGLTGAGAALDMTETGLRTGIMYEGASRSVRAGRSESRMERTTRDPVLKCSGEHVKRGRRRVCRFSYTLMATDRRCARLDRRREINRRQDQPKAHRVIPSELFTQDQPGEANKHG